MSFCVAVYSNSLDSGRRDELARELSASLRAQGLHPETQSHTKSGGLTELVVMGATHALAAIAVEHVVRAATPYLKTIPDLILRFTNDDREGELKGADVADGHVEQAVSRLKQALTTARPGERRYALIVANSNFPQSSGLSKLACPEADAQRIKDVLVDADICGFQADDVQVLLDSSHGDVESAASRLLLQTAGVHDLCLIYYSGHGLHDVAGNYYLATSDTTELVESTALSFDALKRFLKNSKCRTKIVVLDACFAGSAAEAYQKRDEANPPAVASIESGTGTVFLMASSRARPAKESPELGASLYTHHFAEGLRTGEADDNKDGQVTLDELHNFVATRVLEAQGERPTKEDHDRRGPAIVIGRNRRRSTQKKLSDVRNRAIELSSTFLDHDTYEEWRDFLKDFDPLETDTARLQRLDVLLRLLKEDVRPSEVVRAWYALQKPPVPAPDPAQVLVKNPFPQKPAPPPPPVTKPTHGSLSRIVWLCAALVIGAAAGNFTWKHYRNAELADLTKKLADTTHREAAAQTEARAVAEQDCHLMAADDYDPDRKYPRTTGLSLPDLQHADNKEFLERATAACTRATDGGGSPQLRFQLGRVLLAGRDARAEATLREAADQGYRAATTLLAIAHRDGNAPIAKDHAKARALYATAIQGNDPVAMVQRAYMHLTSSPSSVPAARQLLEAASKPQFATDARTLPAFQVANVYLGHLYGGHASWSHDKIRNDCALAKQYYQKAIRGRRDSAQAWRYLAEARDTDGC